MAITRTDIVVRGLIYQDGKYLLMRRPKFKGGGYGLPGGHVEKNETPVEALLRECYEELGIKLNAQSLHMVRMIYREKDATRKIHLVFKVNDWAGIPANKEPAKCKGIAWFARHELPLDLSPTSYLTLHPDAEGGIYREDFDKANRAQHKNKWPWQSELS
ncbi:MAG: NUDIX domain-containing protein [Bacteroidia bacterium]|nr:NUDIX domain-containing protein [Bacteroidia bacterium]